jgi:hypothetical protein
MVVLEHRADPLLEVGGGHDLQISSRREAERTNLTVGWPRGEVIYVEPVGLQPVAREKDLAGPVRSVLWQQAADGVVTPFIATGGREQGCDLFDVPRDPQLLGLGSGQCTSPTWVRRASSIRATA